MVVFKKIAATGKYHDDNAIPDLINYICKPEKPPSHIIGGYGVDLNDIANSMVAVSMLFGKYKKLRLHHFKPIPTGYGFAVPGQKVKKTVGDSTPRIRKRQLC